MSWSRAACQATLNLLTIGGRLALRSMGAEQAIAPVGFDDFPFAELLDPGLILPLSFPGPTAVGAVTR
jgi:LacI family transcriptional regulator